MKTIENKISRLAYSLTVDGMRMTFGPAFAAGVIWALNQLIGETIVDHWRRIDRGISEEESNEGGR